MTPTPTQAHPSPSRRVAGGDTSPTVTACRLIFETLGMAAISYVLINAPEIIHFLAHMEALQ